MIINNINPYTSSRIDIFANKLIEITQTSENDYLFVEPYSIGDVYHSALVLGEFKRKYCTQGQKITLLVNPRAVQLSDMFPLIDKFVGIDCGPLEYQIEALAQRYPIAAGFPIVMQPDMHCRAWLSHLIGAGRITILEAKKIILELDLNSPIVFPELNYRQRNISLQKANQQGLVDGSIIIFNHAMTLKSLDFSLFRGLQKKYEGKIFYDATKGIIKNLEWAKPLIMNLIDIPYFAEKAGSVLAIRSGIVDVLSSVNTKLFVIYPNEALVNDVFQDKKGVAKGMPLFQLDKLGIRSTGVENIIQLDENDGPIQIAGKIASKFSE
jgi:hypothetical protein